jgi:polysaccharide deacetylase 2 family uncharacterized protein YibQ
MAKKPPAKKKAGGSGKKADRWIVASIVVSVLVIGLALWGPLKKFRPTTPKQQAKITEQQAQPKTAPQEHVLRPQKEQKKKDHDAHQPQSATPALLGSRTPDRQVQVAIVIDDLGNDLKQAKEVLALPGKVTLAVMPGLSQSKPVAELAKQQKREVLIHVPMEYRGKNGRPAPGMLRSDMTPMEFLTTVSDDVASVPGAVGINNHEGSLLTENREAMKFLMAELKARNLLFLDSVTSPKSVAYSTAKEFGIRTTKRDVFLDNDSDNAASIRKQLDELVEIARRHGRAVGIGHPHPATLGELKKWLAAAANEGIEVVPVSKLMN